MLAPYRTVSAKAAAASSAACRLDARPIHPRLAGCGKAIKLGDRHGEVARTQRCLGARQDGIRIGALARGQ